MRPPDEMRDYFKGDRERALRVQDEPGGLFRMSRFKRSLIAGLCLLLFDVTLWAVLSAVEPRTSSVWWVLVATVAISPVLLLLIFNPRKLVELFFWGVPPEDDAEESRAEDPPADRS
jgi:hypothetical protein